MGSQGYCQYGRGNHAASLDDKLYIWHINDGEEVFAVLDGKVEMKFRKDNEENRVIMETGDIFYASMGTEHVANPIGEARILVVEKEGSI